MIAGAEAGKGDSAGETLSSSPSSSEETVLRRALSIRSTQVGIAITGTLVIIAVFGPFFSPYSPTEFVNSPYTSPSSTSLLGTDYLGRDALSRFLWGGWSILGLSTLATVLGVLGGTTVGLAAGYFRNWLDDLLMFLMDTVLSLPSIVFTLLFITTLGPQLWLLVLAVAVTHIPKVARVIRAATLGVAVQSYVEAAEARGEKMTWILVREILPNVTGPLMVEAGLRLTFSIAIIASLSFLGFGLQPPAADWGLMINENRTGLRVQPSVIAGPILAIALLTIGTNMITDGVARALARIE